MGTLAESLKGKKRAPGCRVVHALEEADLNPDLDREDRRILAEAVLDPDVSASALAVVFRRVGVVVSKTSIQLHREHGDCVKGPNALLPPTATSRRVGV